MLDTILRQHVADHLACRLDCLAGAAKALERAKGTLRTRVGAATGVRFTPTLTFVLDKLPGPSDEPKANGLVGQVIRLLDMRGLHHAFGGSDGPPATASFRLATMCPAPMGWAR